MSESKRLEVDLPARRVGELTQERSGRAVFRPDAAWARAGQEPRLGLDFLRRPETRVAATDLPCWFENLLPEPGTQLRARLCALHGLREGQSFPLIAAVGRDLIGAVEVVPPPESPQGVTASPQVVEPFASGDGAAPSRMSALTGVQLKFSMSMLNERLALPVRAGATQWIVKIAGMGYEELAEVEQSTMAWARRSGFRVPDHFVVSADRLDGIPPGWVEPTQMAFAVRRFDRRDDGTKVHQEDLCQALDIRPRNKYGDERPHVAFEGALRLVADACGEEAGRDMARRIGFMIASGNTDAHLKNWSLVWGDASRPSLAPCYDQVATISWDDKMGWRRRGGPDLALSLGRERRFARLERDTLTSFARASRAWAADAVVEGIVLARDTWRDVEQTAPTRMRASIVEHWSSVPLLRQIGALGP